MNQQHYQHLLSMVQPELFYLNPCQWCMHMIGLPFCVGHIVPNLIQQQSTSQQYQLPIQHDQYQSPSWGPRRNQHQRFQQAEASVPNHTIPGSSRTVTEDWSFGIDSGHARIGADESPGIGMVWRTPSKNPLIY